jgi:hypothetical protein
MAEASHYRPLSPLAIAGLVLAVIYALAVCVLAVVAWRSRVPLLMPWLLLVPLAAAAISITASRKIRRAEGGLGGLGLTYWGMVLSALFGFGYLAYIASTEVVVRSEVSSFTRDWLETLRQGDVYRAFLATVPAAQRQGDTPENLPRLRARYGIGRYGQKGPLPRFLEHELVQILQQAGPEARIESEGVRTWTYTEKGYYAEQDYQISTREGVFDVSIPVWGGKATDRQQDEGLRQWHVMAANEQLRVQLRSRTPLGETLRALRHSGGRFVQEWGRKVSERQINLEGGRIRSKQVLVGEDAVRRAVQEQLERALGPPGPGPVFRLEVRQGPILDTCPWEFEPTEFRLVLPIALQLSENHLCEGTATIASGDRRLLEQLQEIRDGQANGTLPAAPSWRLLVIDLTFGVDLTKLPPS